MSTIRSSVSADSYAPADFIRSELGYLYKDRVHLEFAEILLSYADKQDIAVCTPRGFLYCYKGELGFSMCLELEGLPTPLCFADFAEPLGNSEVGNSVIKYRATHKSYMNFEPTIILRRYYRGNTNK